MSLVMSHAKSGGELEKKEAANRSLRVGCGGGGEAPAKTAKAAAAEHKGRKRAKKEAGALATVEDSGAVVSDGKRIVVEACAQCRYFKIRAFKVKEDLESAVAGVSVIINPEKKNMPCPFTTMKKLDMDKVIKDIVKKIT